MMLLQVACACALAGSSWAAQADTRAEGGQEIDLTNIPHVLNNLEVAFNHWLTLNPRSYASDQPEVLAQRLDAFKSNAQFVHAHNNEHPSTVLHLNRFADLTFEEFQQDYLGLDMSMKSDTPSSVRLDGFRHANVAAPESVDWTEVGAVTPIKNQGQCGSCWAFSTTGAIEGVNYVKTGKLVSLSEQELVDCDSNGDHGCNGGLMDHAFKYVVDNGGIDTEEDYRYWGSAFSFCNRRKQADRHVVKISGFEDVPAEDEGALAQAVAAQPVAVGICANRALQLYHSGVFDGECCTQLNHGVLAVGYGEEDGKKFWKVKNSWGAAWGEEGYFKLQKDLGGEGQCGIATYASYPVKDRDTNPHVPTICDAQLFSWWECPYETKCRCDFNLFGLLCLAYECEPKNAVSCGDGDDSYCPSQAPDCDAASQWCTSSDGLSSPMLSAVPAKRRTA